jgi:hypothetical protein
MLGLFRAKPPIDRDEYDWMLAVFAWLVQVLDADGVSRHGRTVLATTDFFPRSTLTGHDRAVELFEQVRALAGMADWPCRVVAGESARGFELGGAAGTLIRHEGGPAAGTFGHDGNEILITYEPSAVERPAELVATFAHELAHYLLHAHPGLPPGGADLEEHATDLTAVFLGFGVFMANGAKNFGQWQGEEGSGWQMRRQGYLSEEALTAALAIFVRMTGEDAGAAEAGLKDYLRAPFRQTLKLLDREMPDVRAGLEGLDWGSW